MFAPVAPNRSRFAVPLVAVVLAALSVSAAIAGPLTATLVEPPPATSGYFHMGTTHDPQRHALTVDSRSLRLDAQPWMPVMGEFHYTRYPAAEWREELLKMKAGGIDIVSTYVFWIHHEEIEGTWDWTGRRDLRRFVQTARDVGLDVVVRCGPWCHGEVRNGGLPDWVVQRRDWKIRSTDPRFLAAVHELYGQIAHQLHGLLWKDGGPVIGIQLDNEYRGPAAYLLALKGIARDVGLDVPLYTRTGWPALTTPMPLGEILPLYGVYAEGFWDRELTSMPGRYWAGFQFSTLRTDAAIATELLGDRAARDEPDVVKYPYLTCEIGAGMMTSYHRRIVVDPLDIEAVTLIKIADGSTLPGYYMYHGGTNPEGRRTTLMEAQDTLTTNYNDLPVRTYDFQAPLGEYGEIRPQYHLLRRLHLFLHDAGSELTRMATALPDVRPSGPDDGATLRWAARSDGRHGYVFVNNHERGRRLPPKPGVQFSLKLTSGQTLTFPSASVTVAADAVFWWPFNLNLGGATLVYATAEPVTHVIDGSGTRTLFFAATPGVPAEFAFDASDIVRIETRGRIIHDGERLLVRGLEAGHAAAFRLLAKSGNVVRVVLLDDADSLALWKGPFADRNRVVLTRAAVVFDGDAIRATATASGEQTLSVFPDVADLSIGATRPKFRRDGVFQEFRLPAGYTTTAVAFTPVHPAGPVRVIRKGPDKQGVAMEPTDADFAQAATWRVTLPSGIDRAVHPLLRFDYVGDVARVTLGGRLLTDDFYNGNPRDVGLWRYTPLKGGGNLEFSVLPLQKDAPIFLEPSARPDFGDQSAIVALRSVQLIQAATVTVRASPSPEPPLPDNFRTDVLLPPPPPKL
ncbi:MAG TPA: beta-galactosidase [Opitutaceae bacterium]|nr:beta-galactosidase [Opitutaceae bacterium]